MFIYNLLFISTLTNQSWSQTIIPTQAIESIATQVVQSNKGFIHTVDDLKTLSKQGLQNPSNDAALSKLQSHARYEQSLGHQVFFLPQIQHLSLQDAQTLGANATHLYLPNLQSIDAQTLQVLVNHTMQVLCLDGISELSPQTAQALQQWSPNTPYNRITFNGLAHLDDETLEAIGNINNGHLYFNGLQTVPQGAQEYLATQTYRDAVLQDNIIAVTGPSFTLNNVRIHQINE